MEQKLSIYDPARKAYFEADIETVEKFIKSAEEAKEKIKKIKKEKEAK